LEVTQLNEDKGQSNLLFYAFVGTLIIGLLAAIGFLLIAVFAR
jgi:hypothetical protein